MSDVQDWGQSPRNCHICASPLTDPVLPGINTVWCLRCGPWTVLNAFSPNVRSLGSWLGNWDTAASVHRRSRLSHLVRQQQRPDFMCVGVPLARLDTWGLDDRLPTPAQQLDRFVLWMGDHQGSYALRLPLDLFAISAWIGAPIDREHETPPIDWLMRTSAFAELVEHSRVAALGDALTMRGWQRYEELRHRVTDSRDAFMAMKFNDASIDLAVETCFKPAAARAGFDLRRVTDGQPAGIIDDQMRVAIRTAKFVVADLTLGSHGAYWEAGFAEGLDRPVIYTCRADEWAQHKPHFDTNHLVTVVWDPANLADAEQRLVATIRATLPADANMRD